MLDDLEIVRAIISFRVDGLAEENTVMDFLTGKVEEFGADDHEGFAPFSFDLVGLNKKGDTFFWWIMGNISVVVRILSTSKKAGSKYFSYSIAYSSYLPSATLRLKVLLNLFILFLGDFTISYNSSSVSHSTCK